MSISPPKGPTGPQSAVPFGASPSKPRGSSQLSAAEIREAEKDATSRIEIAHHRVKEAAEDSEVELQHVKNAYHDERVAETDRTEAALQAQKQKGYEQLRDLKRAQQQELGKVRREGDDTLQKVQGHYRTMTYQTERQGKENLKDLQVTNSRQLEYETKNAKAEVENTRDEHVHQIAHLKEEQDQQFKNMTEASRKEYERIKENTAQAKENAEQHFQEDYGKTVETQKETLERMNSRASHKIKEIRQDTAAKLAAYKTRQSDPFYKLVDLNAQLHDDDQYFFLTARVPTHEQKNISVSIKGDNLVVSGYRRNEEKLETDPGRIQGTASFQSFSETFPLNMPVDAKGLAREFDGDLLVVSVPKKGQFAHIAAQQKPEKAKVERPQFPENLPLTKSDPVPDPEVPPPEPSKTKSPGSRTLG